MIDLIPNVADSVRALLQHPMAARAGWVIVHSLWQGVLVAALLKLACAWRRPSARARYGWSLGALGLVGVAPLVTWSVLGPVASPMAAAPAAPDAVVVVRALPPMTPDPAPWPALVQAWVQPWVPWLAAGWFVGATVLLLRLSGGIAYAAWLRRRDTQPLPSAWIRRVCRLCARAELPWPVTVRQSPHVDSPLLMGWWRPLILVPTGLLTGLPTNQVEALLLHELMHVRRHDVLVSWVQRAAETIFFYHPGVWWISHQVDVAREHCCDDGTVALGAPRQAYVQALAALVERSAPVRPHAAALAATDGSVLGRIRRLVGAAHPAQPARASVVTASIAALLLVAIGGACASQEATQANRPAPVAAAKPSAPPAPPQAAVPPPAVPTPSPAPAARPDSVQIRRDVTVTQDSTQRVIVIKTGRRPADTLIIGAEGRIAYSTLPDSVTQQWADGIVAGRGLVTGLRGFVMGIRGLTEGLQALFLGHHDSLQVYRDSLLQTMKRLDADSLFGASTAIDSLLDASVDVDSLLDASTDTLDIRTDEEYELLWPPKGLSRDSLRAFVERVEQAREEALRKWSRHTETMQQYRLDALREQAERLRRQAERMEQQAKRLERRLERLERDSTRTPGGRE